MFELRHVQGSLLKKIVEIIKDLVNNANFDCSSTGFSLQAVDSRHGVMVSMLLRSKGFEHYRSDRDISLGMNLENLAKNLKRADNDDIITIKADDGTGNVTFMFENPAAYGGGPRAHPIFLLGQDNIAGFEMKWTVIDSWNFELPEVEHKAVVRMPSSRFARICKDLSDIGDTVVVSVTKEGVKFSTRSDIGTDETVCLQNSIEEETVIEMNQPVSKTFALRYADTFTKAIPLSNTVKISLSSGMPVIVEYKIVEMGYVRFYLAKGN